MTFPFSAATRTCRGESQVWAVHCSCSPFNFNLWNSIIRTDGRTVIGVLSFFICSYLFICFLLDFIGSVCFYLFLLFLSVLFVFICFYLFYFFVSVWLFSHVNICFYLFFCPLVLFLSVSIWFYLFFSSVLSAFICFYQFHLFFCFYQFFYLFSVTRRSGSDKSHWLTEWALALILLMWSWWVGIPINDDHDDPR